MVSVKTRGTFLPGSDGVAPLSDIRMRYLESASAGGSSSDLACGGGLVALERSWQHILVVLAACDEGFGISMGPGGSSISRAEGRPTSARGPGCGAPFASQRCRSATTSALLSDELLPLLMLLISPDAASAKCELTSMLNQAPENTCDGGCFSMRSGMRSSPLLLSLEDDDSEPLLTLLSSVPCAASPDISYLPRNSRYVRRLG
mmetsp:Transcript_17963/g.24741  ORF Transcript_17963/g.24741 Transcript_17963/m.24741 type:complete len:204 (+) Transcript_17963:94-705(+)